MATRTSFHNLAFVGLAALGEFIGASALAGPPVKLNGPLAAGDGIEISDYNPSGASQSLMQFSPDGGRLFYRVDNGANVSLYSVPSGGGSPVKLDTNNAGFGYSNAEGFIVSPDSSYVYYWHSYPSPNQFYSSGVFAVPSGGGTPVALSTHLAANEGIFLPYSSAFPSIQLSADGSRLVYTVRNYSDPTYSDLYSVPTDGQGPTLLATESDAIIHPQVSPNGTVFYDVFYGGFNLDLSSVPILGGPSNSYGTVGVLQGQSFSPDGSRFLYAAYTTPPLPFSFNVYSVSTTDGLPVALAPPKASTSGSAFDPSFSADGNWVTFLSDHDTPNVGELYSVPSTGGTPVKLNAPLLSGSVEKVAGSPDGAKWLYRAAQDTAGVMELYIVPIAGGSPLKLNAPLAAGGAVDAALFTPNGERIIYGARQNASAPRELYSVPAVGGTPVKLNGPLVAGGNVFWGFSPSRPDISPDSSRLLYKAAQETAGFYELYIVPTVGGTPIKLSAGMEIDWGKFSPDGSRVLIVTQSKPGAPSEIYSRVVRQQWSAGSGDWDVAANWSYSEVPDEVMQIYIAGPASVLASGNAAARAVNELHLGGGTGTSLLTLQSAAAISAINGVVIDSNGALIGNGSIAGDVNNSGVVSPGLSPGTLQIDGDYSQSSNGSLNVELADPSSFDRLVIHGRANLAGKLDLSLLNFMPSVGQTFEILTATGGLNGRFADLKLPALPSGLHFNVLYNPNAVQLAVGMPGDFDGDGIVDAADYTVWRDTLGSTSDLRADGNGNGVIDAGDFAVWQTNFGHTLATVGLTGDYNHDGVVDAADYTVWRDSLGSTTNLAADGNGNGTIDAGDYDFWKSHFGNYAGSSAGGAAGVPEPGALALSMLGLVSFVWRSRCRP